ncbi:hypothetical protein Nwi_0718 [Nitrobacter winogradskyi Nb-255]|uniref:Uncharacterized protein n=2 Tax=Nitrobacter winogradskyi TaxID=913 RepID=Q3SUQ7_NITWN|nr:hypothetical protein Nwi_0718 [Nitrobacter winogradskyi Nb-255]
MEAGGAESLCNAAAKATHNPQSGNPSAFDRKRKSFRNQSRTEPIDPGNPKETSMTNPNEKNQDDQRNQGKKPGEQGESTRKSEIKKAVKEDMPDKNPQGQEKTGYSGGT